MLFNFSKSTDSLVSAEEALASLNSNGVNLSIDELIPYQSKTSLINLYPTRHLRSKKSGNYLARSKGTGMEFDEVRHYQTGDDIRAIDWRVTARTGKTHTKLFQEEVERPVLIATDFTASMLFGSQLLFKSIQAAHIASLVAWHAKSKGDRVGGIVFNQLSHQELKPKSRQKGVLHYLHALVQLHQESIEQQFGSKAQQDKLNFEHSSTSFEQNCFRIRQLARPGSLVYLITDGHSITEEALRHLSHVSRHCELLVCLVSDQLEHALPQTSHNLNVAISNGKTRQEFNLANQKTSQQYQEHANIRHQNTQSLLSKAGARVICVDAGSSIENQLKNRELV
ncbi:DUF58 domain-containing protein [Thalassotalea sp. PLHSN55]|uniref:DUF58 domain-containing protein n=1 Tax=Thalassotalea sp. PLHSN55 TaxID=3435888 RepID=UPI003F87B0B0